MKSMHNQRGFSLVELLVATVTMTVVLGAAVALTQQIQNGYRRNLEDATAEQEARYALDWIGRYIRAAANNPAGAPTSNCPGLNTPFVAVQFDPNNDDIDNDVRLMTDANPPDGLVGGLAPPNCNQANEDVTISLDNATNTITFLDNNTGAAVSTRTDTVIEDLQFVFRNLSHATGALANPPVDSLNQNTAGNVVYIEARITVRTRTIDASSGQPMRRTLSSEVKIRSRG
jgi:type II secretory pathway pseudopilin PulG